MPTEHALGPSDATLTIQTGRSGAAAKAGHDLLIEATDWRATVSSGADPGATQLSLHVDSRSLRVRDGHGGIQSLGDDDEDNIRQTIDDEVLKGSAIEFRSTSVIVSEQTGRLDVTGDLELSGRTRPVSFQLSLTPDGSISARATVKQSDWGMKPYSALFGTLKVADEVTVQFDGRLPAS